jgi:hypothetical protein
LVFFFFFFFVVKVGINRAISIMSPSLLVREGGWVFYGPRARKGPATYSI